jgi:L-asparaginase II
MSEILAHVTRGDVVECLHRGDLVVAGTQADIAYAVGDPLKVTYWRSAAKPFQVLPLIEAGGVERFGFKDEELALMVSSHSGEPAHTAGIAAVFSRLGLSQELLACGTASPLSQRAAQALLTDGKAFGQLTNPCSGKHSAMLALALLLGCGLPGYTGKDHPVQQEMLRTVADVAGLATGDIAVGIDGCGVPVFGLPLLHMARAYALLARPDQASSPVRTAALQVVARVMASHPFFVAGTNRLDTVLSEATGGRVIAKTGAEGVYCVAVRDKGLGLALKIEDGGHLAFGPVVLNALSRLNLLSARELSLLADHGEISLRNHRKEIIGSVQAVF